MPSHSSEYYAKRAPEYEAVYEKPERQHDLAALGALLRRLLRGHDVLELACGTGYWTAIVAPIARSVLATDLATEMLALARAKRYPPGRVAFARADALALSGVAPRYTAGLAAFWWSHVPRTQIADFLRGFHRCLMPNAWVVCLDNRFVNGSSTAIARTDPAGDTYQRRRLADGTEYEVRKNFPTAADLRAAVSPFADEVTVTELTYYWCLAYRITSDVA